MNGIDQVRVYVANWGDAEDGKMTWAMHHRFPYYLVYFSDNPVRRGKTTVQRKPYRLTDQVSAATNSRLQ